MFSYMFYKVSDLIIISEVSCFTNNKRFTKTTIPFS